MRFEVIQPEVALSDYWVEWTFLAAGLLIPVLAALIWHNGATFERSGSLTVFCAAVAEFITVNRLTKKHILNASRVLNRETPLNVSAASTYVGIAAFVVGLLGTLVWGFGGAVWR